MRKKWKVLRLIPKSEKEERDRQDFMSLWKEWGGLLRKKYEKHKAVYDLFYRERKERLMG